MALMQRQLIVPISDLRYLSITCGECKTEITLDFEGQCDIQQCPVCRQMFSGDTVRTHVNALSLTYRQIKAQAEADRKVNKTPHGFAFRVMRSDGSG